MSSILPMLQEILENILYYGFLSIFTVNIFRIVKMIKVTQKVWQLNTLRNAVIFLYIPCSYFCSIFSNSWIKQREFIYGFIKNEKLQWILDSFLSLKVVFGRWKNSSWKIRILSGGLYSIGFWYFRNRIFYFYKLYLILMIIFSFIEFFWDFIYPFKINGYKFQSLLFPIQQRFYSLQTPIMKSRFSKAYFNPALKGSYNKIGVENFCIRKSEKCHELLETFISPTKYFETTTILCSNGKKICSCPFSCLSKVQILKGICAKSIEENALSNSLSMINYSNVYILQIFDCSLNQQDFEIIQKTMNLEYLLLCLKNDGRSFDEKMIEVMEFVVGIPHLRIQYIGECLNPNEFEIMLVGWVLRNGYIKSLVCTANDSFFIARYICQTSPKLFTFDDPEETINAE